MHKNELRNNCGIPQSLCGCDGRGTDDVRRVNERTQRDGCGCEHYDIGDSCRIDERARYERCGCGEPAVERSYGLRGYPLASVYSPLQEFRELYDAETALKRGTVFKELDLPFYGGCCEDNDDKCGGGRHGR